GSYGAGPWSPTASCLPGPSRLALLQPPAGDFGPRFEPGLGEDAADVTFHGPLREHQSPRHLPVGQRLRDEFGHFTLPGGERVLDARLRGSAGEERVRLGERAWHVEEPGFGGSRAGGVHRSGPVADGAER